MEVMKKAEEEKTALHLFIISLILKLPKEEKERVLVTQKLFNTDRCLLEEIETLRRLFAKKNCDIFKLKFDARGWWPILQSPCCEPSNISGLNFRARHFFRTGKAEARKYKRNRLKINFLCKKNIWIFARFYSLKIN